MEGIVLSEIWIFLCDIFFKIVSNSGIEWLGWNLGPGCELFAL